MCYEPCYSEGLSHHIFQMAMLVFVFSLRIEDTSLISSSRLLDLAETICTTQVIYYYLVCLKLTIDSNLTLLQISHFGDLGALKSPIRCAVYPKYYEYSLKYHQV